MTPVLDGEIIDTALGGATIAMVTTKLFGGVPDVAIVHTDMAHDELVTVVTVVIGREHDRAKYQSRDDAKTSDYNSQNPRPRDISTSPLRRVDEAVKPRSNKSG